MISRLLTESLYSSIIEEPLAAGGDELLIISGWVSPSFLNVLRKGSAERAVQVRFLPPDVHLEVLYGMYATAGITRVDHDEFVQIDSMAENAIFYFNPSRLYQPKECHSKVFLWMKNGQPFKAFSGSVNATSAAFFSEQREAVTECEPASAFQYFQLMRALSTRCGELSELLVTKNIRTAVKIEAISVPGIDIESLPKVELPLTKGGNRQEIHDRSGLNWGQRPGRNPDQAYLPVPIEVARSGFFPPRGVRFTLYTLGTEQFECAVCQQNDKAIESIRDNSLLGLYMRCRLGLASGAYVKLEDLARYGKFEATIYQLPQGDYLLDF